MNTLESFKQHIAEGYGHKGDFITLGSAMYENNPVEGAQVNIALKTLNRHGLIAGATGTGKTVTLQIIAENMSAKGIPVLLMDIKGDLSGIAAAGISNEKIEARHSSIGIPFQASGSTVELLSLSKEKGVRLRATVSEFGPVLFSKILELNEVQSGIVAILFKFADDNDLPLLDLKDFKKLLQYSTAEGKGAIEKEYGKVSEASVATILRRVIELETQGGEMFFGEKSFEVNDLLRFDKQGRGIVNIVRLADIQDRPKLFSTFMLQLLAEIYSSFPEAGDLDKPKLCIFIDEAHLIFDEASKTLLNQIGTIIKLIRSKGIGIFFCTQNPYDVPEEVLSQLGLKVQHALRAFTEKDRKTIRKTAENYPISEFYKTDELLTSIGIGQALITGLNEKGVPTPLAATHLRAPASRMGVLNEEELNRIHQSSVLGIKYNEEVDRESAYELLEAKIRKAKGEEEQAKEETPKQRKKADPKEESSFIEKATKNTMVRQVGNTVMRELARGILGVLGLGGRSR
ncbi:MAG: helicase HerA-like domain-containing protein [Flavobacteriales bacterium]|nr:helicase HerA-like domain-containing protein [Flavobacteriales bacterium]